MVGTTPGRSKLGPAGRHFDVSLISNLYVEHLMVAWLQRHVLKPFLCREIRLCMQLGRPTFSISKYGAVSRL
jgi:hypothetical protein